MGVDKKQKQRKTNPFELKFNKSKHDILGRKKGAQVGAPTASRKRAHEQREQTLGVEYDRKNKISKIVDKRLGEKDGKSEEEKGAMRFTEERVKNYKRASKFNLTDDGDEEEEVLTHKGKALSDIEKYDKSMISDSDDDEEPGNLGSNMVKVAHFGGGEKTAEEHVREKISREDMISNLIAKTKLARHEKQQQKDELELMTESLDSKYQALMGKMKASFRPTGRQPLEKDDYDKLTITLKTEADARATPADRKLSEEEEALKEKERLETLEAARISKNNAFFNAKSHLSADADVDIDAGSKADARKVQAKNSRFEVKFDDEGGLIDEDTVEKSRILKKNLDGSDESDDDEDLEDEEEDLDDLLEDEDELEEDSDDEEAQEAQKVVKKAKKSAPEPAETLPFVFEMPKNYKKFCALLEKHSESMDLVLERLVKCHHPSLKEGNKKRLNKLFLLCLRWFDDMSKEELTAESVKEMNLAQETMHALMKFDIQYGVRCVRALIRQHWKGRQDKQKSSPVSFGLISAIRLVSGLFPVADSWHPVVVPALFLATEALCSAKCANLNALAKQIQLANAIVEYVSESKRYVPELVAFARSALLLAVTEKSEKFATNGFPISKPHTEMLCFEEKMEQIGAALQQTLEPDAAIRKRGEEALRSLQSNPGYIIQILQLVVNEQQQIAPQIRIAAAVALKNFVKRNWGPAPEVEMGQEDEEQFRSMLLEAMFNTKSNVQEILSNALYLIAQRDFPEKWPDLVPYLSKFLNGADLNHLVASLASMEQIFRKFRFESKSAELWKELKKCLLSTQEPLTLLLRNMMEVGQRKDQLGADEIAQWLRVLLLIAKVYHSLCSQEIPEYFEDHLKDWMPHFLHLVQIDAPTQTSNSGEPTTLDELKHEICEIFTLYSQRYEEEISEFVPDIILAVWNLLKSTGPDTRYDTMVCAALEFLSMVSQRQYYEGHFTGEGVLKTLAENVCVQNLLLRQQDMELFEDEPLDYMKRDIEGTDVGTRRRGAIDLARGLCRRFEAQMLPCLGEIVQNLLGSGDWIKIDIVYSLITAIAVKTETAKSGVTATNPLVDINDFFITQVATHLNADVNQTPILKADALKFAVTFRKQLAPEHLMTAIKSADALLSSNTPILHKYAAYAIEKILLADSNKIFSAQNLPVSSILQNLVTAFDKDAKAQNSPYLIKAILRIIVILDDDTIRHADAIAVKLAQLVESATKNPADSVHTHFLFETICVLITKTRTIGASLDAQLLPLIEVIFREDLEDLIPYALQITGVLVSSCIARNSSIDQFSPFLPFLLSERLWARSANVPAALSVLEVILSVNAQRVVSENSGLILSHLARLLGSKTLDQYGFQLAATILPSIEHFEGSAMTFVLNTMFRRVQSSKTPKFMKLFIVFLCRFTIARSAQDLVQSCENIQTGMFGMLIEKVVCIDLPGLKQTTTGPEKRIIAIGMGNLLADVTQQLVGQYGILSYEVAMLLEAASASDRAVLSPEEEQASMYNAEGEFVNPFCRLSYAPKQPPVAANIANHKAYFAQAVLVRGPGNCPETLRSVPPEIVTYLQSIQQ